MKQYDTYKPSGIEWLGEIPEHWEVDRIKDYTYLKARIGWQGLRSDEFIDNSNWYCLTGTDFSDGKINWMNCYCVDEERYKQDKKIQLKIGDLLITKDGTIGKIALIDYLPKPTTLNSGIFVSRPLLKKYINPFMYWVLSSNVFLSFIDLNKNGTTILHLYQNVFERFYYSTPPLSEQTAIANYLDTKTAAIDRKIELLTAKAANYKALRRSLINETVCRGLNPNAPLKDSGIEWIGKIPQHWEVKRVKEIFYIGRGRVIGQDELVDDGKYPVFSSQTENNGCLGYIDTFDFNVTLLTWTTDGANAGTLFKREGKFNCTNVCGTLKPKKRKENLDFILYVLQIAAKHNKRIDTNGAKIMNNEMSVLPLLYPPTEEQEAIAQYLNDKTTQIDTILTNISEQITKLTQLRKTLINDVVTGKIKVTG